MSMSEFLMESTADDARFTTEARTLAMLESLQGAHPNDHPLFLAGYDLLRASGDKGERILEICGGGGTQAAALARLCPKARIIGLDLYVPGTEVAVAAAKTLANLEYHAGDAFDLSAYPEGSFDLIFGQAALHHLAHDLGRLSKEAARVLRPGGKLVFIFEPMGHNLLVAAIRAVRMARHEFGDESNLYYSQFRIFGRDFQRCDVQVFNLAGYFLKGFPKGLRWVSRLAHRVDHFLFRHSKQCRRWAANANIIFTKSPE